MKKWSFALVAVFFLVACGGNDDELNPIQEEGNDTITDPIEQMPPEEYDDRDGEVGTQSLSKEDPLKKKLEAEPGIENVMIERLEGDKKRINVDITLSGDQEEPADVLADKYANMIKEDYPDHIVDIIITRDGSQLTHKTYD